MKEKIRILEMEASKGWGGQEKRTVRLINNLNKKEFEIFFAAQPDSNIIKNKDSIDAKIIPLKMRQSYDIKAIYNLCKTIKKYDIDIISTHSGKDAWLGAIAGKIMRKKIIRVRHLQTPINSVLSYNLSTKVVTVSKRVEEYLNQRGVKKEKLTTIYTGIDTDKYKPYNKTISKKGLNIPDHTIAIGIVAVLRAAKRHKDLIEAISKIDKDIILVIVGDGPQKKNIQNIINEKKINDKVIMIGHKENIENILPAFDIFVLPSDMEALGTSILEASSCEIPCIGTNVGGIPECIIDKETGFLFEKHNIKELKEKLEILIEDEDLRKKMGVNARLYIEKNFSIKSMTEKTENLYKSLMI